MQINLKKIVAVTIISGMLSACMSSNSKTNNTPQNNSKQTVERVNGNVAEFVVPQDTEDKTNYKEATRINAELVIDYSNGGYLDRAKTKLIKAQDLAKQHDIHMAILDYAAGYYYQSIGARSIASKYYEEAVDSYPKDFKALNFYAQFLCKDKDTFAEANELFNKSMYLSNNNDMAQTLYLYSECMYSQNKKNAALQLMIKADSFRENYRAAKLRLAQMYYEAQDYKSCYKVIYSMKDDKVFFNNRSILILRLKLAEYAHNKNEAAAVRLILSSSDYNDLSMDEFFSEEDQKDVKDNA